MPQPKIKIEITKAFSGRGFAYGKGEVVDLPTSEALYWIGEGLAKKFVESKPVTVNEVKAVTRPVQKKTVQPKNKVVTKPVRKK